MSERFRDSVTQNSSVTSSYLRRKRSILPSNTFVLDNDLGNLSDDWWLHIPSDVLPKQRRVSILTDNTVVNNLESPFHDWHRYINRRKAKVPETSYDKSLSDSQHAFVKTENSFHHEKDEGGPGSRSSSPKSNLHQGSADRKSRRRVKHSNNRFKDFSAENSDLGSSSMTVSKQYSANADSSFLRSPVGQDALHVDIREEREEVSKSGEVSLKRTLNDKKNVKGRGSALGLNSMMSPKSMLRNSIEDKVNDNSENFTFQEGDLQGNFQRLTHQNRSRTRNRFRDLQVDDTDITEEMEPRQSVMYNINNDAVVDDEVISRNFEPKYDQEPSNLSVSKGNLPEESSPMENIQGYIKNSSNTKNRFLDLEVIDSDTAELVRTRDSMPNDADEVSNLLFSKTTQSKKSNPKSKTLSSNRKTRSNTNNRFCDVDTYDSDSTELMSLSKSTKYNLSNSSNVCKAEASTSVVGNFLNDVEISNGSMGGNNVLKHNNSKEKMSTSIHKTQGPLKNRFHDLEINDSDTTASIIQLRRSKTNEVSNVLISTNYQKEKNRRLHAKTHSNTNNRFRDLEIDDSDTTESLSSSQFMAKNVSDTSNFLASRKNERGKSLSKDKTQVPRQQTFKITENRFIDFQMDDSDSTETSKSRKSILKNVNESSNLFLTENVASQKGYPDGMIQVSTHKATPKNDAKNTKNRFNNINQFVDDSDSSDEEKTEILPAQSPGKSSATIDSIRKPSQSSLMVVHSSEKLPAKSNDSYQLPRSSLINTENNLNLSLEESDSYSDEEKEKSLSKPRKARHSLRKSKSTDLTSGVKSRNSFVESSSGKSPTRYSSKSSLLENSPIKSPRKNSSTVLTSERKSNSSLMENSPRRSPRKNNSTVSTSGRKSSTRLVDSSPRRSLRENNSTVPTSGRKTRSSFVKNSSRQLSSNDRSSISPPGRTSRNSSLENSPSRSQRKNNSTVLTSGRKTRSSFVKNSRRPSSSSDCSTISPPGRTSRNSSVENSPSLSQRKNNSTVLASGGISGQSLEKDSLKLSPLNNSYTILTPGRRSSSSFVGAQSLQKSPGKTNSSLNPSSNQVTEKSPNVSHRMNHISVRMSVGNSLRDIYSLERTPTKSKNYSQFPKQSLRNYEKKLIISPDDSDRSSDEEAEKTLRQSPKETSNSIHSSGRMLKSSVENMHSQETVSIKAKRAIKFSDHTSKNDEPPRQSFIKSIKTIHSAGQMSKSSLESLHCLGSLPVKGNNDLKNFDQSLKKMTVMTPDDPSGAQILEKNNLFQSLEDESPTYQAYERSDNVNSLKNYKRSEHFGNAIENRNDFIHSKDSMNLKSSVGVGADKRSQSNLNESSVENRSKKSLDEITELSKGGEIKDNLSVNHQPSGNLNTVSAASLTKLHKQLKVNEQISRKYDVSKGLSSSLSQSSPIIGTLGSKRRNRKISDHLHRVESASNSNNVHDKLVSGRKQVDTENEDVSEFQKDYIENEVVEVSSNVRTSIKKLSMHALHKSAHDTEMDLIDKNSSATSNFTERLLIPIAQSTIIGSKGSTPKKSTANKTYGSKSALSKKLTRNQGNTSYKNSSLPLDEHASANNSSDSEIRSEMLSPFQEKMKNFTKSGKISSGIENPVDGSSQRKMRDTKQHVKHESLVKTADAKRVKKLQMPKEVNKNQRHSFSLQNMSPYHIVADNKKSNDTAKRSSLKRKSSVAVLTLKQSNINYKTTPKALQKSNISEHQRRDSSSSGMSVDDDDALEIDSSDDTLEKHPDIKNLLEEYTQPPKKADVTNQYAQGTLPYYFLPVNAAKTNIKETIPVKRKSTKPAKSVNPDKICDGVVYKKPRLAMPAPWVNKRLYKKVTQAFSADLEENEIVSNIKVEKYILKLHDMVKSVLKHIPSKKKGNGDEKVLAVMRHLYRAKLIRCKMDFYRFCSDYFPEELLIRARLYPIPNGPSIPSPKDGFLSAKYLLRDLNL